MNQAHILYDTYYPNARKRLVYGLVAWIRGTDNEIQASKNFEDELSEVKGMLSVVLNAALSLALFAMALHFQENGPIVALLMFHTAGVILTARSKLIYPLLEAIKFFAIPSQPIPSHEVPIYNVIQLDLPIELPPPR